MKSNALTASQLVHEVRCSKRKIDTIKECEECNWIEVYKSEKGHRHIRAMPILIKSHKITQIGYGVRWMKQA